MADEAEVEQILAHGGWELDDAQARHAANPETFWLPPEPERRDCGWAIWAGDPDMQTAADSAGFEIVDVAQVRERSIQAWRCLALPPGWAFVLRPEETTSGRHRRISSWPSTQWSSEEGTPPR